jgi:hypothetical protein
MNVDTDKNDALSKSNESASASCRIESGKRGKGGKKDLLVVVEKAIGKVMLDNDGTTDKGYFTPSASLKSVTVSSPLPQTNISRPPFPVD